MSVAKFIINKKQGIISIEFNDKFRNDASFEYLRVYSPVENKKSTAVVAHKKQVTIIAIEPLAKHGYRIHFDDGHQAIYSNERLRDLLINQDKYWKDYLQRLKNSPATREATIEIKEL